MVKKIGKMTVLLGGFKYENENNEASINDGNLPANKTSNLLDSGGKECVNNGNTNEANDGNINNNNINYIAARL